MPKSSILENLKNTSNLTELAYLLRVQPKTLSYNIYIIDKNATVTKKYSEFDIPKKGGGTRTILAPNKNLKYIQSQLSKVLYSCIEEINENKGIKGSLSYGYRKGSSIFNNANVHKKKRFVFNIDLKNYFDAFNFGRVRGFFIKNKNFNLEESVATVIAQIACHNNVLPQGSPVSPVISNLIGHILDIRLAKLASDSNCSYSRYCDDITFSTNEKIFPKSIAYSDNNTWHPSKKLVDIISRSGFEINMRKVRMSFFYSQQQVTGLTVNQKVNTTRVYRDTVRSLVHNLCVNGDFEFRGDFKKDKIKEDKKLDSLQGMLNYIARIEYQELRCNKENKRFYPNVNNLSKSEKTFRDYVLFRYFFNPEKVTIFGEGKTDKSHLMHYLRYRAEVNSITNKPIPANFQDWRDIKLLNFESRIFDVISKSGGTGDIKKLISEYTKYCKKFYKSDNQNPVIILVDDDDGSSELLAKVEGVKKKNLQGVVRQSFYHIGYNLYLVFLPRINSTDTDIESFYSKSIIDIPRKGLYFEKSSLASSKSYGKKIFATEIVPRNHEQVDWSVFDQIFERIQLAIDDFKNR